MQVYTVRQLTNTRHYINTHHAELVGFDFSDDAPATMDDARQLIDAAELPAGASEAAVNAALEALPGWAWRDDLCCRCGLPMNPEDPTNDNGRMRQHTCCSFAAEVVACIYGQPMLTGKTHSFRLWSRADIQRQLMEWTGKMHWGCPLKFEWLDGSEDCHAIIDVEGNPMGTPHIEYSFKLPLRALYLD